MARSPIFRVPENPIIPAAARSRGRLEKEREKERERESAPAGKKAREKEQKGATQRADVRYTSVRVRRELKEKRFCHRGGIILFPMI